MTIETTIQTILSNTIDPFTQRTSHELGIKVEVASSADTIDIHLTAGFPCQHLEKHLLPLLTNTFQQAFPHYTTHLVLEQFIQAHRTQLPGKGLRGIKNTIAIASGKGGVGKSTVSVHLATHLAALGARVGILDADIYGPSIPMMLGKTDPVQMSGEHYLPVTAHGIQAMSIGYLTKGDEALIWRGPMLAKALIQMLDLTLWDNLDYLFIDLPPGTGDIQLSLAQKIPLTGAIIVTTPQNVATLDAQKALMMFERTGIDVIGIIENMSQYTCTQCGHQDTLFGHGGAQTLCDTHKTTLLGQLPLDATITQGADLGQPIVHETNNATALAFEKVAIQTGIAISKRPLNYQSKFPPIVVE